MTSSNNKPFGNKCKCTHFESQHQSIKKQASIKSVTQDFRYMIPPAEFYSEFTRGGCKICDCSGFEVQKKKNWWSRG